MAQKFRLANFKSLLHLTQEKCAAVGEQGRQILVSTQSSAFLNNFDFEDVIVVNREGKESQFTRLDPAKFEAWLEEYSLGEIWEKNVIGGGPH